MIEKFLEGQPFHCQEDYNHYQQPQTLKSSATPLALMLIHTCFRGTLYAHIIPFSDVHTQIYHTSKSKTLIFPLGGSYNIYFSELQDIVKMYSCRNKQTPVVQLTAN